MTSDNTPRQNPFSLYDFIGYLIPGIIFIFLILIYDAEEDIKKNNILCDLCNFFKNIALACDQSFLHALTSLAFFLALAYVLGQIISILSNLIIEKSSICRHHNYFSYILLNKQNINRIIKERKIDIYELLLSHIYIFEIIFYLLNFISFPTKKPCCPWSDTSFVYEKVRLISTLDQLRTNTFKKISQQIISNFYKNKNADIFDLNKKDDFFDLIYHYVVERTSHHLYKIQNYVALYGFMRNLSMVFCILFWVTLLTFFIKNHSILIGFSAFLYSFLSFITMIGLHKYKRRFTIEVFQAASALSKNKSAE